MSDVLRLGTTVRRLNVDRVREGVEKECPSRPGLFVRIRPAATWSPHWRACVREENEKALARLEEGGDAARIDFYEDANFIADALVSSMRGIYDVDGGEVPYTHEIGVQILSAPENADVKEWVVLQAQQYSLFYEDEAAVPGRL